MWFLLLFSSLCFSQIEGRWITEDKSGVIEITKIGELFQGKVVGGEKQGDGLDSKNPNPALRSRELMGLVVLKDLKLEGSKYVGGEIYDPNSGNTYKAKAELMEDGRLKLRGFVGISLFGRNEIWIRETP
jgi:uncharacterized protein (DUF2147 family)